MSVIGFDIGNENSYIAAVKYGGIEVLDNEYSLRSTPTYVAFTERSRNIGVSAKSKLVTNLENTVFGFKRLMGKKLDDSGVQEELAYLPHEVCSLPSGNIGIKVNYLKNSIAFSTEQLMAMMLTKLKMITESKLNCKTNDCVIAVPVYYTDTQRRAMLDAVRIAGLNALKLINESAAIAVCYGFFKQNLSEDNFQNVVFVDLGHSSLTVTACAFTKGKVKVLGCVWDHVGGRDFDNMLVQHFINDFKDRYKLDPTTSKKALMTLMLECEMLKKIMSANPHDVKLQIECFMQEQDVIGQTKREHFENIAAPLLNRIELTLRRILVETQLKVQDIHSVEIVGGSSRLPAVKELIRKIFEREPNATLNQDEAVARGCALQCALLSPLLKTRDYVLEDKASYAIKIVWKNTDLQYEELEVFTVHDKVPSSKMITICMSKPFSLESYYVEPKSKQCKMGTFTFENVPESIKDKGFMKLKIKASLDIHGIFTLASAKGIEQTVVAAENDRITPEEEAEPDDETDQTEDKEVSTSLDQPSQDARPNCVLKSYDLIVNADVPGLTRIKQNEYINAEQQMIARDAEEKEKADSLNALEEFIFHAREKLNYELEEFVSENDKNRLLQWLNETEDWLCENEDLEAAEYSNKLRELKSSFGPVFERYSEWDNRPFVIESYFLALEQAFDALNDLGNAERFSSVFSEDIEKLRKIWQNSKLYLDEIVETFSKLKKSDDIPITVGDLKQSLEKFKAEFNKCYVELKAKKDAAQEKNGDGDLGSESSNPEKTETVEVKNVDQQDVE